MPKITVALPNSYIDTLDSIANQTQCSRSEVIRQAIKQYLEDDEDLAVASARLQDSSDPALSWAKAKESLCK